MKKIYLIVIFLLGIVCFTGCDNGSKTSGKITWNCIDVTSYDRNRNNDMKCISSNGDVKYTSYEGARVFESL